MQDPAAIGLPARASECSGTPTTVYSLQSHLLLTAQSAGSGSAIKAVDIVETGATPPAGGVDSRLDTRMG